MARALPTTPRADLRAGAGVNTKFAVDPSVYTLNGVPNAELIQSIIDLGIGYIRERWYRQDPGQDAAFRPVTQAGVGLFMYIGRIETYTPAMAAADVASLAESPFADSVVAVCG